jgi:hypothetical protein
MGVCFTAIGFKTQIGLNQLGSLLRWLGGMTPKTVTKRPVGRPRVGATPEQVLEAWSQWHSWRQTAKALGIGTATAMRLFNQAMKKSVPPSN